jgi:hypothetical protein
MNEKMRGFFMNLKEIDLLKLRKSNWFFLSFFALGLLSLNFYFYPSAGGSTPASPETEVPSIDTYIPKGHVLVPLELTNLESMKSFVGDRGVVDLYLSNDGKKGAKIGSRVKIIRAPLNPDLYAALVSDSAGNTLLGYSGPFVAVVQNKNEAPGELTAEKQAPKYKVIYKD